MNDEHDSNIRPEDDEFNMTLGWLAMMSVSIASWAGFS